MHEPVLLALPPVDAEVAVPIDRGDVEVPTIEVDVSMRIGEQGIRERDVVLLAAPDRRDLLVQGVDLGSLVREQHAQAGHDLEGSLHGETGLAGPDGG